MKKLTIAFIGLNALDIGLTLYFVGTGVSTELNPVMARVLALPLPAVISFKTILPAILVAGLLGINTHTELEKLGLFSLAVRARWVLLVMVAVEAGVCLFNMTGLIWS
jgi:hypothetical protein